MKIVGIHSSHRIKNSYTLQLLNAAMAGAQEAGAATETIELIPLKINFCSGCFQCYRTGKCAQKDDFSQVMDQVINADGLVLSSPVYIMNVSGALKVFLDRTGNMMHEQQLDGKYGFSITSAGGGGDEAVLSFLNGVISMAGGYVTGGVGYVASRGPDSLKAAIDKAYFLGKDLALAIEEKRSFPDQDLAHKAWRKQFAYAVMNNKESWAHNYEHWKKKGWIQASPSKLG